MNKKQKLSYWLGIIASLTAIVVNVIRIINGVRDLKLKHEKMLKEQERERLEENDDFERKIDENTEQYKRDHKHCSVCKFNDEMYINDRCQECISMADGDRRLFVYNKD